MPRTFAGQAAMGWGCTLGQAIQFALCSFPVFSPPKIDRLALQIRLPSRGARRRCRWHALRASRASPLPRPPQTTKHVRRVRPPPPRDVHGHHARAARGHVPRHPGGHAKMAEWGSRRGVGVVPRGRGRAAAAAAPRQAPLRSQPRAPARAAARGVHRPGLARSLDAGVPRAGAALALLVLGADDAVLVRDGHHGARAARRVPDARALDGAVPRAAHHARLARSQVPAPSPPTRPSLPAAAYARRGAAARRARCSTACSTWARARGA